MTKFDHLAERTPSKWTLVERHRGGPWSGPNRAVWQYDPRPGLEVRVVPRPEWESGVPRYCVQKEGALGTDQYTVPSSGFSPHVDEAERIMRGVDGVTSEQVTVRLGVRGNAAGTIATRIRTWTDLRDLHEEWLGDLTRIDGVGPATNDAITAAVEAGVLDHDPVEAARNPDESDEDKHAVYVLVPALHDDGRGWRVRKEWRAASDDCLLAHVMLPTEKPVGELHATREDAEAFAEAAAAEREGEEPDDEEGTEHVGGGQTGLGKWSE